MNYQKIYNKLCERSKSRTWKKFTYEKHHIIPKSLGGSDKKENIAILTPREHCIAHMLLVRIYKGEAKAKMIFALKSMSNFRNKRRSSISSRLYESLRRDHQKYIQDPDFRQWRSEITKKQWTPERRASVSDKARQQWAAPNSAKRQAFSSDEYRALKSKQTKKRWQDPEFAQKQSEWTKAQWQDPAKRPRR